MRMRINSDEARTRGSLAAVLRDKACWDSEQSIATSLISRKLPLPFVGWEVRDLLKPRVEAARIPAGRHRPKDVGVLAYVGQRQVRRDLSEPRSQAGNGDLEMARELSLPPATLLREGVEDTDDGLGPALAPHRYERTAGCTRRSSRLYAVAAEHVRCNRSVRRTACALRSGAICRAACASPSGTCRRWSRLGRCCRPR